jgi:hypothetical protein
MPRRHCSLATLSARRSSPSVCRPEAEWARRAPHRDRSPAEERCRPADGSAVPNCCSRPLHSNRGERTRDGQPDTRRGSDRKPWAVVQEARARPPLLAAAAAASRICRRPVRRDMGRARNRSPADKAALMPAPRMRQGRSQGQPDTSYASGFPPLKWLSPFETRPRFCRPCGKKIGQEQGGIALAPRPGDSPTLDFGIVIIKRKVTIPARADAGRRLRGEASTRAPEGPGQGRDSCSSPPKPGRPHSASSADTAGRQK